MECENCGTERPNFVAGSADDHCPVCGLKEGCCNIYDNPYNPRVEEETLI
ncbi:MAG TPA: hypothetical protein VJC11_01340 [Patescibacteria group bacterium]|nr:hypothetical protein [Patescibacteria group bacterium]